MKITGKFFILAFALAAPFAEFCLAASENSPDEVLIKQADELFDATLFDESISAYKNILQEIQAGEFKTSPENISHIRFRLAQAYFTNKNYAEAVAMLQEISNELSPTMRQTGLYILALAHKNLGQHENAITVLNQYLNCDDKLSLHFYDEVQYELGLCHFLSGKLPQSRIYFELLSQNPKPGHLYYLSQIYLARIDLSQGHYLNAEKILAGLDKQIPEDHVLRYELAYWHGEAFYQQKDYLRASEFLEKAIPKRHLEQAEWYPDTLYLLGWAYLKFADDPMKSPSLQKEYFDKAEEAFKALQPDEKVYLALGQLYLGASKRLHDQQAYAKAMGILSKADAFSSLDAKAHVLLLKAESANSYELREKLYKALTEESYRQTPYFAPGWYQRGLNNFNEGIMHLNGNLPEDSSKYFLGAANAFMQAFEILKDTDKPLAGMALKYQAEAYSHLGTQDSRFKAFALFEQLMNQYNDVLHAMSDPSESFYLHALIASQLATWEPGDKFADIAENSLRKISSDFPKSSWFPQSLYLLGSVLYHKKQYPQAEQVFLKLTLDYPHSDNILRGLVGDSYFWTAKCLSKQKQNPEKAMEYRRKVFEEFPASRYAAEAYFTYYTYRDYLQGERQPIKHLLAFPEKFPDSPFLINAYYLIGMDYKRDRKTAEGKWIRKKNMNDAIEAFQLAESAFDKQYESGHLPKEEIGYFINIRYHCTLERALANLSIADESQGAKRRIFLEYAEDVLKQIYQDFKNADHPLTRQMAHREPYSHLLEESSYWLAQTFSKAQNDAAAEKILSEMLENYRSVKITRGYFLSRVWYDLGLIAMRRQNYRLALQQFAKAEDAAKGKILTADQKIDLWIQESVCYREINELDKAMLILSKAINDDAISSLRVKAMFLRAEIYSLQGRKELARKQLEATSKNAGEWAQKAKQKLDEEYGYQ